MTIPALSRDQRYYLGKLIWRHIDGVAENVNGLMGAINRDPHAAVRIVATHEWERAVSMLQSLQELISQIESSTAHLTIDQVLTRLRELGEPKATTHARTDVQTSAR